MNVCTNHQQCPIVVDGCPACEVEWLRQELEKVTTEKRQLELIVNSHANMRDAAARKICECGDPDCLAGSQTFTPGKDNN